VRIGGSSLGLRTAVVRRPVDISPGARGRRHLQGALRALVIGDAGSGDGRGAQPLDMAEWEAEHVAQALSSRLRAVVTRLSRAQATGKRIVRELAEGDYDLVHFAGHAWASPADGYLLAWDRVVVGTEIAPLLSRRPPSLLVMSTHHTAFFPLDLDRSDAVTPLQLAAPERLGEPAEDRGFTALAMRCGVTSFVGCCGSVSDAGSALVMAAFYDRLVRGDTVPQALRAARRRAFEQGDATGMMFVAIGDGGFRLGEPARTNGLSSDPTGTRRRRVGRSLQP
jgi:CHAT domain-containing protein